MDINANDLESQMHADKIVISYCADKKIATEFYFALCNMRWRVINTKSHEDKVIDKLKGMKDESWSCTWRYAGGIIAEIRNKYYNSEEDYLDFYCMGNEGIISDTVRECFERMGWESYPYDN
jgi:isochorismate hydrolase